MTDQVQLVDMQEDSSSLPSPSQPMESESDVILIEPEESSLVSDGAADDSSSMLNSSVCALNESTDDPSGTSKLSTSVSEQTNVPKVKMSKEQREAERKRRQEEKKMAEEERQRKRVEREKQIEEKRLEKLQKKQAVEEQRKEAEEKRREKERLLEEKRKEREEKKRLEDEEKAKKRLEEEEKAKKAEELQLKQKKVAEKFIGFFQKRSPNSKTICASVDETGEVSEVSEEKYKFFGVFKPQKNETLATIVPQISRDNFVMGAFDSVVCHQDEKRLYLDELTDGDRKPYVFDKRSNSTTDASKEEDSVERCDVDKKVYKAKLIQFKENVRPPYFGTWTKRSSCIGGRTPFAKDSERFDYEVDSDDEWEEEEKGESIRDSDSEASDNEDNDYELDEFFVPHGHLSDDENQEEDIGDVELMPDGQKKRKLLTKEKILIEERTKKLKRLVPKAIGCLWMENDEFLNKAKFRDFERHRVVFLNEA
jgi:chromatin assembly factor 1 subunit A